MTIFVAFICVLFISLGFCILQIIRIIAVLNSLNDRINEIEDKIKWLHNLR